MIENKATNPLDKGYLDDNKIRLYYKKGQISLNKSENCKVITFDSLSQMLAFGKANANQNRAAMKAIYKARNRTDTEYQQLADKVADENGNWAKSQERWLILGTQAKLMQNPKALESLKKLGLQNGLLGTDVSKPIVQKESIKDQQEKPEPASIDAQATVPESSKKNISNQKAPDDANKANKVNLDNFDLMHDDLETYTGTVSPDKVKDVNDDLTGLTPPPEQEEPIYDQVKDVNDDLAGLTPPPEQEEPIYDQPDVPITESQTMSENEQQGETNKNVSQSETNNFEKGTVENEQNLQKAKEAQDAKRADPENMSDAELDKLFTDKDPMSPENQSKRLSTYTGDLTQLDPNKPGIIIQQVNCMNKMGAGLAGSLMKRWPKIADEYHKYCDGKRSEDLLGRAQSVKLGPSFFVVNSFSQLGYGRKGHYTHEDLLIKNIRRTSEAARKHNWTVFVPHNIGAGLGGGDWKTIYNGIKDLDNVILIKQPEQKQRYTQNNYDRGKSSYGYGHRSNYHRNYDKRGYGEGYQKESYGHYGNHYDEQYYGNHYRDNYNNGYRSRYNRDDGGRYREGYSERNYSGNYQKPDTRKSAPSQRDDNPDFDF